MATSTCDNPRCNCSPCLCEDCRCNTVRLGRLEQQVMEILWATDGEECSGRQVSESLPDHAYTTVSTVLDRLSHKGLVRRRMAGRIRHYAAIGTGAEHAAALMREALQDAQDRGQALAAFVASMSATERDGLTRALGPQRPAGAPPR